MEQASNKPKQPKLRWLAFWKPVKKLSIAVTDFCNLDCSFCCQGIPLQKDKKITSLEELERISQFFKPFEFDIIKVAGGEPTIHPQFAQICDRLQELFPARSYELATNGCLLEKYLDHLVVFNGIELSRYPGRNDATFLRLAELKLPNVYAYTKEDHSGMQDVYQESNLDKTRIFKSCPWTYQKYIIQSRIYPCCLIFGQSLRQNINRSEISVPIDDNWRENLAQINLEPHCRRCFINVNTGGSFRPVRKLYENGVYLASIKVDTIRKNRRIKKGRQGLTSKA